MPPQDPDMTTLFFVMVPCPSGRGFECNRILTKAADAVGAVQNVTGGLVLRMRTMPVVIPTTGGDMTATLIDWDKFYVNPDEPGRG